LTFNIKILSYLECEPPDMGEYEEEYESEPPGMEDWDSEPLSMEESESESPSMDDNESELSNMEEYESEPQHMEAYTYSRFDLERPGIRLLRLCMGTGPTIECKLFQAWIDGNVDDTIPYEALSYTWGGMEMSKCVHIDNRALSVTENLYSALYHLRYTDEDRILWVDAICIDQSDLRERGHQVAQMGQIYSRADRVIIWLGPSTEDVDLLFECLKELEKRSTREWHILDDRWSEAWSKLQCGFKIRYWLCMSRQCTGLQSLLNNSWFRRVWIIQEVANAKRAIVCSGSRFVMARTFAVATQLIGIHIEDHCKAILDILPGEVREKTWWATKRDLFSLLEKFRDSESSDPRDKIYALLGICSDGQDAGIPKADYTRETRQVVHDTAKFLFGVPQCLQEYTMRHLLQRVHIWSTGTLSTLAEHASQKRVAEWLTEQYQSVELSAVLASSLIQRAAANVFWGKEVVSYLLDLAVDIVISESILATIIKNKRSGGAIIQSLARDYWNRVDWTSAVSYLIFDWIETEVDFPAELFMVLLGGHQHCSEAAWENIFQKICFREHISEEIAIAVAQNHQLGTHFWNPFLARFGSRISVTERLIVEVVQNVVTGRGVLAAVVKRHGPEILLTSNVAQAALVASPSSYGLEIVTLLHENERSKQREQLLYSGVGDVRGILFDQQEKIEIKMTVGMVMNAWYRPKGLGLIFKAELLEVQVDAQVMNVVRYSIRALARILGSTGCKISFDGKAHWDHNYIAGGFLRLKEDGEDWFREFDPHWDMCLSKDVHSSLHFVRQTFFEPFARHYHRSPTSVAVQDYFCWVEVWKMMCQHANQTR
jgi:hypothetical protein